MSDRSDFGSEIDALVRRPNLALDADNEAQVHALLHALPVAVYTTDAAGRITFYNEAAAALWGCRPKLGSDEWCGSWRLFWPDGSALPHDQCPMAIAIKENRAIDGMEAAAERPDGVRVPFMAFPTPLRDASGKIAGAVNMLVDITERKLAEKTARFLASIVEHSDDAIVTKDVSGIITSWNNGAERLFGYTAEEAVGKSVTMLIPPDRQDEEVEILGRIRRGARIDHYETVRQRKDGSLIDVSLTVSPLKDAQGRIIGASKIARDITERKRSEAQIATLAREAEHRAAHHPRPFALVRGESPHRDPGAARPALRPHTSGRSRRRARLAGQDGSLAQALRRRDRSDARRARCLSRHGPAYGIVTRRPDRSRSAVGLRPARRRDASGWGARPAIGRAAD